MSIIARKRLALEFSEWRAKPLPNFSIEIAKNNLGKRDQYKWICLIPGKKNGPWEGAFYKLVMSFDDDYPSKPPKCIFETVLFHPNVFPSGTVCLSILNEDEDWKPSITVKQLLLGIQDLMDYPNIESPAQVDPYKVYKQDYNEYLRRVREQVEQVAALHLSAPQIEHDEQDNCSEKDNVAV